MQSFHLVLDLSLLLLPSSSKSNFLLSSLSDILSMPSQPCFLCFDTSTFFTGFIIIALLICLSLSHHIFIATSSLPSSSRLFSSRVLLLPLTSSLNGQQLYILSPSVSVAFSCRTKLLIKKNPLPPHSGPARLNGDLIWPSSFVNFHSLKSILLLSLQVRYGHAPEVLHIQQASKVHLQSPMYLFIILWCHTIGIVHLFYMMYVR